METTTTNPDIPGYIQSVCEPGGTAPRSPPQNAATLTTPAVLLVHDALAALGRQTSLLLVPGAEHGFAAEQEAVARPVVDEFLTRWLK